MAFGRRGPPVEKEKKKKKRKGEVERYKARLVARGFSQKYGIDYDEVFAPVVRQTTFRILLTLAGQRDMVVKHFDAKTAFLNRKLKERIYMSQPEGYIEKNKEEIRRRSRLIKGIYGLKQAAKVWHDQLSNYLKEYGFVQSIADPCLYIKVDDTNIVYLIIYVDDFLIAAKDIKLIDQVADFLRQKFQLKDLGILSYYLGMEIRRNADGIFCIKQSTYIQSILNRFGVQDAKTSRVPLDQGYLKIRQNSQEPMPNSERYQQLIGSLLYLAVNSRPDIAASVTILSQYNKAPTKADWNEAKRIARHLKGTAEYELRLGEKNGAPGLIGYADADWGEDRNTRISNSGYLFQLFGSPISWACRQQDCVADSSMHAEYIALAEATREGLWIRYLLEDFDRRAQETTVIYEDNQSCLKFVDNGKFSNRSKHIHIKYHFITDIKKKSLMDYKYCPTNEMIADMLTKTLGKVKLQYFAERSGLVCP